MNERFFRKQMYQVGQFYQIDSFNSVYLDKTGEMIAVSEGRLKNWNGNMNEFHFTDESGLYNGKVNMNCFWYNNPKQGDYDEKEAPKFIEFIKNNNELIDSVYCPKYYTRIGFRMQFILKKTSELVKEKYKHFYDEKFSKLSGIGKFTTTAVGFDILGEKCTVKVNINFATRNTNNDINAPKEGLLFDLDFYKEISKAKKEDTWLINNDVLKFAHENYESIICSLASELGII